jgi:hypothetical protein
MESKEFKKLFDTIARHHGFELHFGGWFKESNECIVVLDLQKSGYGNYFELNIKTYIQGVFGNHYRINKDLVKKDTGDIFTRQPKEYNEVLDLDSLLDANTRKQRLEALFTNFIVPDTNSTLTRAGIVEQAKNGTFLLPAIRKELGI